MSEPWKMPDVHVGDDVLVWPEPTSTDASYGKIVAVCPTEVDIMSFHERGARMFSDCLHKTDPRIAERPGMFQFDERGIFDFTAGEKARRDVTERLAAIEAVIDELAVQVAEATSTEPRKRGRPKKRPAIQPLAKEPELAMV